MAVSPEELQVVPPGRLAALTGLRFIAAVHVVLYHFDGPLLTNNGVARDFFGSGISEVGLFFVLSGFVLAYGGLGVAGRKNFWMRRISRVYPAFFVATVVSGAFAAHMWIVRDGLNGGLLRTVVSAVVVLTLTQAWLPQTAALWNGPAWSLSCEAFFYLTFPWLMAGLRRLSNSRLHLVAWLVWLASLGPPIIYSAVHLGGLWRAAVLQHPLTRLPDFVVGCSLGLLFARGVRLPDLGTGLAIATLVGLGVVAKLPEALVSNATLTPLFGLFIFALASSRGVVARFLSTKSLQFLGEASFAFYILQRPVRWLLDNATPVAAHGRPVFVAVDMSLLLAVSCLILVFVERPGRRLIVRVLSPRVGSGDASQGAVA